MTVHVYGVVAAETPLPSTVRGRQGAPLRLVNHDAVAAIVADVDPEARIGRADLLAHAHVLEAVVEDSTVLPMRFGTIVAHDDEVAEHVLRSGEERLVALLGEFAGLQQLTVRGTHDPKAVLISLLEDRPDVRFLRDTIAAGEETYAEKLRLGQLVMEGIGAIERMDATMLLDELAPLALDISVEEPSKQHQVLEAALLVRREDRPWIDASVAKLRRTLPDRLRLRYVGPQPPYAFIDTAMAGEPTWA